MSDTPRKPNGKKKPFEAFLTYDNDFHLYLQETMFKSDSQLIRLRNWIDGALKYRGAK